MATPPTFVSATATGQTTVTNTTFATGSIAVQNGDILVGTFFGESAQIQLLPASISTTAGSTSAWTLAQEQPNVVTASVAYVKTWTATATATGNITVQFSKNQNTGVRAGGLVTVWRGSNGIGGSNKNNNGTGSGAPTISYTTTADNSALVFAATDFNAVAGTVTFTASNGTPVSDLSDQTSSGTHFCLYGSHVVDAGATGAKTMGMSAPSTQRYVCTVVEVLGIPAAGGPAPSSTMTLMGVG